MGNMKKANMIISAVMLVIGIGILFLSLQFKIEFGVGDPGAGFWPTLLGSLLILLSLGLFFSSLKNKVKLEGIKFTVSTPANKRVYIMMTVIVGFCLVLYFFGFYIAAILFIPAVMHLLEVKSIKRILLTTVVTAAAVYVLFGLLLHIALPGPIFMR